MLTSIVILTLNHLDQTMRCLNSIRLYTDSPYEVIIVDNGSTDGSAAWLAAQPDVCLIANSENRGFAAACNQGAAIAGGQQLLLLNNDTVVTPRWLSQLLTVLHSGYKVGIVGPMSNYVMRMQWMDVSFSSEEEIRRFGESHNRVQPDKWREVSAVSGFCMLLRRETWEQLGGLDEAFGIGGFEDIDIGYRALRAGWALLVAGDTFVFHEGSLSFDSNGLDVQAIACENRRLFLRKWSFNPDRLLWFTDPAFLPGGHASGHPHHAPVRQEAPNGWYAKGEHSRVFRIEGGRKRPVVSLDTLRRLRVRADRIAQVSEAFLQLFPDGAPLNAAGQVSEAYPDVFLAQDPKGGMYMISHGIRYPISSDTAFAAMGMRWKEAVNLTFPQLFSLYQGWPIGEHPWEDHELLDYRLFRGPDNGLYYSEGQRLRAVPDVQTLWRYGMHENEAVMLPVEPFVRVPRGFGLP